MTKRSAIAKGTAVGALAVVILAGAVGIYYYTMAPATTPTSTTSSVSSSFTSQTTATNSSQGSPGPAGGYQNSDGQPQGSWANYLGYIPAGYVLAPHYPNAPTWVCPPGMDATQCTTFKASCGNGVCDPNESCTSCPIDCGVSGQLTCDPYTGRPGAPISVCQLGGLG